MNQNKVFNLELCKEDAERIISALQQSIDRQDVMIEECDVHNSDEYKEMLLLEYHYKSELMYYLSNVFEIDNW